MEDEVQTQPAAGDEKPAETVEIPAESPKAEASQPKPEGRPPREPRPQGQGGGQPQGGQAKPGGDRPPRQGGRPEGGGPRPGGGERREGGGDRRPDPRGGGEHRGGREGGRPGGGPGGRPFFDAMSEIELEKLISDSLYLDNQAHAVVARMRDMDSGTKSQLRRLYNAVRRAVRAPESERQHHFVMLRARLAYTIARHSLRSLDALERLLLQVTRKNDAKGYERFKDLFEAIVAYNE